MDDNQNKCIKNLDSNLQIVACAGAGKTLTVVHRILNILDSEKASPKEIVAITFTEKAAGELKQRIFTEYNERHGNTLHLADMYIGTIHGFCLELLTNFSTKFKKFEVINDIQTKLFLKQLMFKSTNKSTFHEVKYYKKNSVEGTPIGSTAKALLSKISPLLSAFNIVWEECIDNDSLTEDFKDAFDLYSDELSKNHFFTYSSILYEFYKELANNSDLQNYISSVLKFITIDEFQDVNTLQNNIFLKLKKLSPNLNFCVVGDDDQTIYHWRGSDPSNFSNFKDNFSPASQEFLTKNYRSSKGIVDLGKTVISINKNRINKSLDSNDTFPYEPHDILLKEDFINIEEENDAIIEIIDKLKGTQYLDKHGKKYSLAYNDMCILSYSPSKLLEFNPELIAAFEDNGIPVIIEGTKTLFSAPEIIDIVNILIYFNDSFMKAINSKNIDFDIRKGSLKERIKYFTINSQQISELKSLLAKTKLTFQKEKVHFSEFSIQSFIQQILMILNAYSNTSDKVLYNLASFSTIVNDFEKIYFKDTPSYRYNNFVNFLIYDAKKLYPEGWLNPNYNEYNCVKIISIHKSKGLEFPVIIMPHLCTNFLFPPQGGGGAKSWNFFTQKEPFIRLKSAYEEKIESLNRLMYVAITRSKKYLFMTKAISYKKPTGKQILKNTPKQFSVAFHSTYATNSLAKFLSRDFTNDESASQKTTTNEIVFDFSTLQDYFTCPYKFQLKSVYGFTSPLNMRMGFGKSVHNMLEFIHKEYYERNHLIQDSEIERLVNENLYLPFAHEKTVLYKDMEKKSKKIIESYLDLNKSNFKHIEFIEQKIDFKLEEYIFINGRIDLVKNNNSGEIQIIDFKSTNEVLSSDLKKDQLMIYALGYYNLTNEKPTTLISYDLSTSTPQPIEIKDADFDDISSKVQEAYSSIKNLKFKKSFDCNSKKCKECEYFNVCKKD
jgi:DNA helicase-2/ATP-dependent DNA helicase PcrA